MTTTSPYPTEQLPVIREGGDLRIVGHVTLHTRHLLKQGILDAIEHVKAEDGKPVRVDFALAGTLDSSAIGALVSGSVRVQEAGRELIASNLSAEYREVLDRLSPRPPITYAEDLPQ